VTHVTHVTRMRRVPLVAHLIGKDLRAAAAVALIWIFLMSIEVALQLTGAAARPRQPGRPSLLVLLQNFLPFAEVAVAALIVSLVIHEDPLVDARAFWLTRPIPRGQLFLAKLIGIALTILAPALAALAVVLAWYHVPPVYMMRAGFEVMLWLAFPLLLLTAAATLTSTLARYVMLLVGVLICGLAVIGLMESFRPPPLRVFEARLPRFADPARIVIVTGLLIAGFFAAIHQCYRRRDWRIAVGCIALTIGASTQVSRFFPAVTFFDPLGDATGAWTNPAITRLRLLDDRKRVIASHPRELFNVAAPVVLDGLPNGYTAAPFTLEGRLTRADGTVLRSGRSMPMQMEAKGDYQPSLTLAYGNDPIDAGPTSWEAWPMLLELPQGHRVALGAGGAADGGPAFYTGAYKGTFYYRIARHEPVAALRLDRPGTTHTDGPRGITIVDAQDLATECRVTLEVSNTELTLAGPREPSAGYYFADRQTGARLRARRVNTWSGMLGPLRVGLSPGRRIFTVGYVQWNVVNLRDDGDDDDDGPACEDTELIFVRTTAAGSLTRSIELPDFQVQPTQDSFFRR
jgi:hypothetical protein